MIRSILIAFAAFVALSGAASASQDSTRAHLKQTLPQYGFSEVDVDSLSSAQVAQINHILHSSKPASDIRGGIGAVLGNRIWSLFK